MFPAGWDYLDLHLEVPPVDLILEGSEHFLQEIKGLSAVVDFTGSPGSWRPSCIRAQISQGRGRMLEISQQKGKKRDGRDEQRGMEGEMDSLDKQSLLKNKP